MANTGMLNGFQPAGSSAATTELVSIVRAMLLRQFEQGPTRIKQTTSYANVAQGIAAVLTESEGLVYEL
jgi:hypothetical protein